jgi:hypothetical protein
VNGAGDADLRRSLAAARERLAALADRVARVRARLGGGAAAAVGPGVVVPGNPDRAAARPFGGAEARPIDDLELNFHAVDVEGSADAGPDQNKAR